MRAPSDRRPRRCNCRAHRGALARVARLPPLPMEGHIIQGPVMIYARRTYDIKPRSLPAVAKRLGEQYEKRKKHAELAASWHTEIGPLNQIIHLWGYKDLEERGRIREAAVKD